MHVFKTNRKNKVSMAGYQVTVGTNRSSTLLFQVIQGNPSEAPKMWKFLLIAAKHTESKECNELSVRNAYKQGVLVNTSN